MRVAGRRGVNEGHGSARGSTGSGVAGKKLEGSGLTGGSPVTGARCRVGGSLGKGGVVEDAPGEGGDEGGR
ncbi:unnamed protein product [Linum trigynum]|uniref:Uncharacterized protein n=1 Tax=Linum trigynum TaxID=586398 RepID=A0AAV2FE46_9ROSI